MLYLICDEQQRTKVGITADEETFRLRLAALQTGNADKLIAYCVFTEYGIELEQAILEHFQEYRTNGGREWLKLPPQPILEFIALTTWHDWDGINRDRLFKLIGVTQ